MAHSTDTMLLKRLLLASLAGYVTLLLVFFWRAYESSTQFSSDAFGIILVFIYIFAASFPILALFGICVFMFPKSISAYPVGWSAMAVILSVIYALVLSYNNPDSGYVRLAMIIALPSAIVFSLLMKVRPLTYYKNTSAH